MGVLASMQVHDDQFEPVCCKSQQCCVQGVRLQLCSFFRVRMLQATASAAAEP